MVTTVLYVFLLALLSNVGAFVTRRGSFVYSSHVSSRISTAVSVVTGPKGKAASSPEEDLVLTLKVVMDHDARSTTVSKEQFISQMQELQNIPKTPEPMDVSVPYNAAAKLAYEETDKTVPFDEFAQLYEEKAVEEVKAKSRPWKNSRAALTTRRLWTIFRFLYGSLEKLAKVLSKRLLSTCQKAIWMLKLRIG